MTLPKIFVFSNAVGKNKICYNLLINSKKLKIMFNKILAICSSAMLAFFIYLLCEAKLSIGIASAFFFLSVFLLNSFFLIEDKLNKDETNSSRMVD